MKTYKLIIELSDSMLEKMASIEEALKEGNSGFAFARIVTSMALEKKLAEEDSLTVNMDAIVDDKELGIIEHAAVSVGVVAIAQEAHIKEKEQE